MTSITPNVWHPVGLDVTRDGYQGRLGVSYKTGQTVVAGATNGLAVLPDPQSGHTLIYAGSVNGGVYVREVDLSGNPLESDTSWRWVSMPGSGYEGSQSIGHLAISADGRYLAVGRGDTSNYTRLSTPGAGLQVGEILQGGDIRWIPMDPELLNTLDQELVSGLQWSGHNLITSLKSNSERLGQQGPFNTSLSVNSTQLTNADLQKEQNNSVKFKSNYEPSDYRLDAINRNSDVLLMRSRSWINDRFSEEHGLELQLSFDGIQWNDLQGSEILSTELIGNEDPTENYVLERLAIHPELINGKLIAFIGSSRSDKISRVDRLEINPNNFTLIDHQHEEFNGNEIGTGQASTNFSLTSNPRNSDGMSVVAGGNNFPNSNFAPSLNFAGGLLQVDFGTQSNQQNWTPLYGPRLEELKDDAANTRFAPFTGQPHADSRTVRFTEQDGKQFAIQTDDGGIWALQMPTSNQSQSDPDFWWRSLAAPGLNTFEVMMSDWDTVSNTAISSFQDNAASFGQFGDKHFTNYWYGDGEIAIVRNNTQTNLQDVFLSAQKYYISDESGGLVVRFSLNEAGDIAEYNETHFELASEDDSLPTIPWIQVGETAEIGFILPFEANPYDPDSIVMAGGKNIYETTNINANTWTFKKLLPDLETTKEQAYYSTAVDNQGSLYITASIVDSQNAPQLVPITPTKIFGRSKQQDSIEKELQEIYKTDIGVSITDIAHKPATYPESDDTVYWIEGGKSLRFSRVGANQGQSLRWKTGASGTVNNMSLSDLGIELSEYDQFGLQSVVFIPGNELRAEQLVIGGLQGHWIAELDPTSGKPGTFQAMPWQLSESKTSVISPGAHVSMTKYIPEDDLLIAGTIGKGSWIYSFSGDLGKPPTANNALTTSEVGLQLFGSARTDKRGNLKNHSLVLQADRNQIKSSDASVNLNLILHDVDQWRRYLKRLSNYEAEVRIFKDDLSQEALARFNNLSPASWQLEQFTNLLSESYQSKSDDSNPDSISIPLTFPQDVSQQILTITANDYLNLQPDANLRYSLKTTDGSAVSTNTINLNGGSGSAYLNEIDLNQILKDSSTIARGLSENSDYELVELDTANQLIGKPLTVHGARFLETTTAGIMNRHLSANDKLAGMPSRGLQMDLTLQNSSLPSIGIGFELDVLRNQPAPGDTQEILTILDEDQLDSWAWYDLNYNPLSREGARLYDLDGDGHADWVYLAMRDNQATDADPASGSIRLEQAIAADMSKIFAGQGLGDIDLTPIFTATDNQAVQLTTRARRDGVLQNTDIPLQLSASLEGQANSVNSFGMLVYYEGEPTDLESLSGLDELKSRSQILFSNLKQGDSILSNEDYFKQQLSLVDYQQVRFFEIEGADLSELKDLDDPRLRFHEPELLEGSKAKIQSSSGLIVDLELSHNPGDLDALIGQQQTIKPVLDFTGLARDMGVNAAIEVSRDAALQSDASFYRVLDTNGAVQDPISGEILLPNDPGYKDAALHQANKVDALNKLTTENGLSSSFEVSLQEQSLLAPVLHLHGQHYFAFADANPHARSHIRMLGNNIFGFEATRLDTPLLNGKNINEVAGLDPNDNADYNDLIVALNFSVKGLI